MLHHVLIPDLHDSKKNSIFIRERESFRDDYSLQKSMVNFEEYPQLHENDP
jgi:hypothetical protein